MLDHISPSHKNTIYAPILVGISLLMMIFVLYPLYTNYVEQSAQITRLETTRVQKETELKKISDMQSLFAGSGSSDLKVKVKKYNHPLNTPDILQAVMINTYTESSALNMALVEVGGITVSPAKKIPNGLSVSTVTFSATASTVDVITEYIDYLTQKSGLAFSLDTITLPLDTAAAPQDATPVTLSITLSVYGYE
jgi:hypothetical protein